MFSFKDNYNINDLIEIVRVLRSENGCPWDKEQNHESIKPSLIEEVYEVIEAIDMKDASMLREELGDVLLQVVFHCQLENEISSFDFDDVCDEICKKLIIRHPHVFGNVTVSGCDEVLTNWENIKQHTKGQTTYTQTLESVPKTFPALMKAQKVGKRAAKSGMDFATLNDALERLKSEITELQDAVTENNIENIKEELGDVLFSCTNVARKIDADAEQLLTDATEKFIRRFAQTENLVRLQEIDMKSLSIEELDAFWDQAKAHDEK
ncbi:MAG: nucleoside triphosphate pyrophosphohydrolase [Oscillospiraceae bacterium]|nr:nucleoside triphosphate pyrophosphohydrolase [Oscillospiraceae bacterium]